MKKRKNQKFFGQAQFCYWSYNLRKISFRKKNNTLDILNNNLTSLKFYNC